MTRRRRFTLRLSLLLLTIALVSTIFERDVERRAVSGLARTFGVLVIVAVVVPAIELLRFGPKIRRRRTERKRKAAGLCLGCGYDVRATPEGRPCPECGRPVGGHFSR